MNRVMVMLSILVLLLSLIPFYPLRFNLYYGQVSTLVCALALMAGQATPGKFRAVLEGAAAAVITAMKIYPGLLFIHFILLKKKLQAVAMVATLFLLALAGWVLFGAETHQQWLALVGDMVHGARIWLPNQSIDAFLHRFMLPITLARDWYGFSPVPLHKPAMVLKLALVGAWVVKLWRMKMEDMNLANHTHAISLTLVLFALLPPISWMHYYVYCLPGLFLLMLGSHSGALSLQMAKRIFGCLLFAFLFININSLHEGFPVLERLFGPVGGAVVFRFVGGLPLLCALALFVGLLMYRHPDIKQDPS